MPNDVTDIDLGVTRDDVVESIQFALDLLGAGTLAVSADADFDRLRDLDDALGDLCESLGLG